MNKQWGRIWTFKANANSGILSIATYCKYFRHLYCISTVSALCIVSSPRLSPACLPVRQLPIPPPRRPNILALHKFLMSVLKSPATSTHWWLNLLRQTNTTAYTCFCTFLAALTLHMQYSEGQASRCWKANGCSCRQLQDCSFFIQEVVRKGRRGMTHGSSGGCFIDCPFGHATWTRMTSEHCLFIERQALRCHFTNKWVTWQQWRPQQQVCW